MLVAAAPAYPSALNTTLPAWTGLGFQPASAEQNRPPEQASVALIPAARPLAAFAQRTSTINRAEVSSRRAVGQYRLVNKPEWEAGIGAAYIDSFDYPGSADANQKSLALPFFIYRSSKVRLGEGGAQAIAYETPRIKLDVSLGASLSAESSPDGVRAGMEDLDFLFEFGPAINVLVFQRGLQPRESEGLSAQHHWLDGARARVRWKTALRAVVATDFSYIDRQGSVVSSELEFALQRLAGGRVDLRMRLGTTWASRRLQGYFYDVPSTLQTPARAAYTADSGLLASEVSLGFGWRVTPALRWFVAVDYQSFASAANRDSPLHERDSSRSLSTALVWSILSSDRQVQVFDD